MKTITIRQPWAWAIIAGLKNVENRTRRTHHGGPLLIHAGITSKSMLATLPDGTPVPDRLAFGCLLGTVEVIDCVPVADMPPGPFVEGPWCWLLRDPKSVPMPIPYRGRLGLFDVPDGLLQWGIAKM
jgi:hypothetical protein